MAMSIFAQALHKESLECKTSEGKRIENGALTLFKHTFKRNYATMSSMGWLGFWTIKCSEMIFGMSLPRSLDLASHKEEQRQKVLQASRSFQPLAISHWNGHIIKDGVTPAPVLWM